MKLGITMLIHNKDDIEFVTEFPYLFEHHVPSEEKLTGTVRVILSDPPYKDVNSRAITLPCRYCRFLGSKVFYSDNSFKFVWRRNVL